jgi:hypothetical protein
VYGNPPPSNRNDLPNLGLRNLVSGVAAVCTFAYLFYLGVYTFGVPWALGIGWLRSLIWAVVAFGVIWALLWLGALLLVCAKKSH